MNSFGLTLTALCCIVVVLGGLPFSSDAQLDPSFYKNTCPKVHSIVREVIRNVSKTDPRMLASLVRLHFHDCFVLGCDASVLLNKSDTVVTEQEAFPNINSLRGLDVVNRIKTAVENECPDTVSCADILALSAQISSILADGPNWKVPLGRRDGLTANQSLANTALPAPFHSLDILKSKFKDQGLDTTDLVALSVQESLIQHLTQLIYKNCAKYVLTVDQRTTSPILTQPLLINLIRTTTQIFKVKRVYFKVTKNFSQHLVLIPLALSTSLVLIKMLSLRALRLQLLKWAILVSLLGTMERLENIATLLTKNLLNLVLSLWLLENQKRACLARFNYIRGPYT
ncbi:unnamed protein product [Trifolium pratense]|uniref:Uncharacterized protein n=1 Tax=Trifolium pratense TaxID=57577 RepID=A0ACB0KND1_TRIPR|nr:unnamed protein product [Trifolium pratense]